MIVTESILDKEAGSRKKLRCSSNNTSMSSKLNNENNLLLAMVIRNGNHPQLDVLK